MPRVADTSRRRFAASVAARMLPAGALARSIERADTDTRRAASDARGVDANGDGDGDDARGAVARGGARARANGATTPRAMDTEVRRARDPMRIITTREFSRRAGRDGARGATSARDFAASPRRTFGGADVARRFDASGARVARAAMEARGDGGARDGEKFLRAARSCGDAAARETNDGGWIERGCGWDTPEVV